MVRILCFNSILFSVGSLCSPGRLLLCSFYKIFLSTKMNFVAFLRHCTGILRKKKITLFPKKANCACTEKQETTQRAWRISLARPSVLLSDLLSFSLLGQFLLCSPVLSNQPLSFSNLQNHLIVYSSSKI